MCLAQGHNTVTPYRLELAAPQSRVMHSTTEPLCSLAGHIVSKLVSGYQGHQQTTKHTTIVINGEIWVHIVCNKGYQSSAEMAGKVFNEF